MFLYRNNYLVFWISGKNMYVILNPKVNLLEYTKSYTWKRICKDFNRVARDRLWSLSTRDRLQFSLFLEPHRQFVLSKYLTNSFDNILWESLSVRSSAACYSLWTCWNTFSLFVYDCAYLSVTVADMFIFGIIINWYVSHKRWQCSYVVDIKYHRS